MRHIKIEFLAGILILSTLFGCGVKDDSMCNEVVQTSKEPIEEISIDDTDVIQYVGYIQDYRIYSYDKDRFSGQIWVYIPELVDSPLYGCTVVYYIPEEYFYWVSKLGQKVCVNYAKVGDKELFQLEEYGE